MPPPVCPTRPVGWRHLHRTAALRSRGQGGTHHVPFHIHKRRAISRVQAAQVGTGAGAFAA
ncbi:hypothetical protein GY45DRAFT_1319691 [Cubamyces sp. BRFM 1775]|nr:hypothetical protein GY45DRAFT_1319691 [Cubamyces sp. BRFM 1775]